MKDKVPKILERGRITKGLMGSDKSYGFNGAFVIDGPFGGKLFLVSSDGIHWKPVNGYDGIYEISNVGQVRALSKKVPLPHGGYRNHEEAILKPEIMAKGYHRVTLCSGHREMDKKLVHVLVAEAFIQNERGFPQVNHIDGNKSNNSVSNLEWCSAEYNLWHAFELGLREGEFHGEKPEPPIRCDDLYQPWEHVSVSAEKLTPSWDEMKYVKELCWSDNECVVQFHPPASQYVNNHPNVLHLWRHRTSDFRLPPQILVGIKELGELR